MILFVLGFLCMGGIWMAVEAQGPMKEADRAGALALSVLMLVLAILLGQYVRCHPPYLQ